MRKAGRSLEVITVTQSSQGSERKCLRDYKLSRIDGLKLKIDKPSFKYGKAFHDIQARYFGGATIEQCIDYMELVQLPMMPEDDRKGYAGLIKGYFSKTEEGKPYGLHRRDQSLYFPEVRIEVPFIAGRKQKMHGVILKGVIDLIAYDYYDREGERMYYACLVDHKTSTRKMDLTLRQWSFQLYYYRLLFTTAVAIYRDRKKLRKQSSSLLKGFSIDPPEAITDDLIERMMEPEPRLVYNYAIKSQAKKTEPVYTPDKYQLIQVPKHNKELEAFMNIRIERHVARIREAKRFDRWPQEPLSCYDEASKFSECQFYSKCVMHDDSKYVVGDPWGELRQARGESEASNFFSAENGG